MSRTYPVQRLIMNLEGRFDDYKGISYIPKEEAYEELKELSSQDYGYDIDAWHNWYNMVKPDGEDVTLKPKRKR